MAQVLDELGMDVIKNGVTYSENPEHMEPVIVDHASMKEYLYSIVKADIANHSVQRSEGSTPPTITLYMNLWGHAGIPGGNHGKYLGHIKLVMEEMAFVLVMAKYL